MNWKFGEITYGYFFILLPFFIWQIYSLYKWKQKKRNEFADHHLQERLFKDIKLSNFLKNNISLLLIFCLMILALMDLQGGTGKKEVRREGIDIVFVVDVSLSMDAQDIKPSRLEKSKEIIESILTKLAGDRVGIVIFAGRSYTVMPLSTDYNAASLYLKSINTSLIPTQGTNLTEAVSEASARLAKTINTSKAIILFSDGEIHEGNIPEAVKVAVNNKITIISIGIGTTPGAPIPQEHSGIYKKDNNGDIVISKLKEHTIKQLAVEAGGKYISGDLPSEKVAENIFNNLNKLDKKEQGGKYIEASNHYFQIFVLIAFLILIIISLTNYKKDFNA